MFATLSENCPIEKCILTDCSSDTAPFTTDEVELDDEGYIAMSKREDNGLIGLRLCVACSNKVVTKSAKIKVT